jgi:magnesium-transporting ATPase (P-type)
VDELPFDSERKRMSEIFIRKPSTKSNKNSKYEELCVSKLPKTLIYTK